MKAEVRVPINSYECFDLNFFLSIITPITVTRDKKY